MNTHLDFPKRQRGAVLIVSLLFLLVMTVLAISMSQTTRLEERMAGSYRDSEMAFQAAETGLRGAEAYLQSLTSRPVTCNDAKTCKVVEKGTLDAIDRARQDKTWWTTNGTEYGSAAKDLPKVESDPRFVIEYYDDVKVDGLTIGRGSEERLVFYRTTSRAVGATTTAEAVNESVFSVVEAN